VRDLEAWREHYALTTQHWYRALVANKNEAIKHIGEEKFRTWVLFLAGSSIGFYNGSMHIVQILASKRTKGHSGLPLTRGDLYVPMEKDV